MLLRLQWKRQVLPQPDFVDTCAPPAQHASFSASMNSRKGVACIPGVNLREASSEFGNRFYQIMPAGKKGLFHEFSHDILFIFFNRKNLCQLTHLVYKVCNSPNV